MEREPLLDEMLYLLNTVNRINRNLVRREGRGDPGDPISLSAIQMHALITIRRYGVLNMSELADQLQVTRPQLTKIIDALVEMGLIVRRSNPESRREVLIEPSEKGGRLCRG